MSRVPTTQNTGSHYAEQDAGHAAFLVAWQGDKPLGWVVIHWEGCLGPNAKAAYPESAEIMHLQVRPECRNQGAGSALIEAAEKAISNRSIAVAAICVGLENPDATRLYEGRGYQRTGITDVSEYEWVDENETSHHARGVTVRFRASAWRPGQISVAGGRIEVVLSKPVPVFLGRCAMGRKHDVETSF